MTIWISKFAGPLILVLGLHMALSPERVKPMVNQFLGDRPLVLVSGILAMVAGLAIVNTHNLWVLQWPVIITGLGWALLLGGALRILAPGMVEDVGAAMMARAYLTRLLGAVWALLGVFLSYKAYVGA